MSNSLWLKYTMNQSTLHWRRNELDGVSGHQPRDCLLTRLFRHRSKKTSKLRVTGLCEGNSPGTGEFPAQMASNAENVSIWWRHHAVRQHHRNNQQRCLWHPRGPSVDDNGHLTYYLFSAFTHNYSTSLAPIVSFRGQYQGQKRVIKVTKCGKQSISNINKLRPGHAYIHRSLIPIAACSLFGIKVLREPMLNRFIAQLNSRKQTPMQL